MPGMDGYQACELLKADPATHDIPVIFISALTQLESKMRGFTLGGADFITKPFQSEEVLARVRTHLSLRSLQRQLEQANAALQKQVVELDQGEVESSYEMGDEITVYYDRRDPQIASLQGGGGELPILWMLSAGIALVGLVVVGVWGAGGQRRSEV